MTREELRQALTAKIDNLNKPKGSLGRLEELALQIGLIQGTLCPVLSRPFHLLLGADHGIEREGVSASPRCVTWQQMINFSRGGGAVNMFCRQHNIELRLVDVGVDYDLSEFPSIRSRKIMPQGTHNFRYGPAMSAEERDACFNLGKELAEECRQSGCNIISIGEMGIGNTSPSSLWMHLLLEIPLKQCVGMGSGLPPEGVRRKYEVLCRSLEAYDGGADPLSVAAHFGGLEMNTAVGAMLHAASCGMTILVDGFIMTACALMAEKISPGFYRNAVFCHEGDESGHRLMLQGMGAKGLLSLGMRLGEGTGALCAYPIVQSAVNMINEMNNFDNAKITKYF